VEIYVNQQGVELSAAIGFLESDSVSVYIFELAAEVEFEFK
jgi:hypothetical protein